MFVGIMISALVLYLQICNDVYAQGFTTTVQPTPSHEIGLLSNESQSVSTTNSSQEETTSVIKVIPVGTSPNAIVLNEATRKAYIINSISSNVSIIDISSDTFIRNIWAGQKLYWGLALVSETDSLYVSDNEGGTILEIQEANSSVVNTISLGPVLPEGIAINAQLNKLYVAHSSYLLSVIDLSTNQVIKQINTGCCNHLISINETTNLVYVTKSESNQVVVINGNDDSLVKNIPVQRDPWGIAINSRTNLIYVTNDSNDSVSVIDGSNNSVITTIPVQHQPLGITVNEEVNRVYVANSASNSVSIIDGSTHQVVQTLSNVGRQPSGIVANAKTGKVYVTNELDNTVAVILDDAATPTPSALTPIIIVPGYYASFNAHRMFPSPNNFSDKWEWWPAIFGYSAGDVYQPLIDALEKAGYNSDPNSPQQNLFIAYYNWLRPNSESATNDLTSVINQAVTKTTATKVHIITHSNGGLVTRNWIQNNPAPTIVDQLIMLAPPNEGVARVYPAWAGGDISREHWTIKLFVFDYLTKAYEVEVVCLHLGVCLISPQTYHSFIHEHIPSARDLIPVYDFWLDTNGQFKPYKDMVEENRNLNLDGLNTDIQNALLNKVNHLTIIGSSTNNEYTFDAFQYQDCTSCSPLWLDGKITANLYFEGDGTVGRHHVKLPGVNPIMVDANHTDIVRVAIPNIFNILNLSIPTPPVVPIPVPTPAPSDALIYTVVRDVNTGGVNSSSLQALKDELYSVPVEVLVIDPLDRQLGYKSDGTFINQIPNASYYGINNEPKIIYIPNPLRGIYNTVIIGKDSGSYGITVNTQRAIETSVVITGTTLPGLETVYGVIYNPTSHIYLPVTFKQDPPKPATPFEVKLSTNSQNKYQIQKSETGNGLTVGSMVYTDRNYIYKTVPGLLQGSSYMLTANNDAGKNDLLITISVNKLTQIYVAHSDQHIAKPSWLNSFQDTGENLTFIDREGRIVVLSVFTSIFPAGDINLGADAPPNGDYHSMYTMMFKELKSR